MWYQKSRFISNDKKGQGILSNLEIKTTLSKIPFLHIFLNYKTCRPIA